MQSGKCLPEKWTDQERWVWSEIKAGKEADFKTRHKTEFDVSKSDLWKTGGTIRRISSGFLKCILTQEPWCSNIPYQGVRIRGAWFPETVDLSHAQINAQLWIEHCRLEEDWIFKDVQLTRWLSLENSYIGGIVDISDAVLDAWLLLEA